MNGQDQPRKTTIVLAAILSFLTLSAQAQPLRFVSWNADNYAAQGQYLRGKERTSADHAEMREVLREQNGDIIALQEIASAPAAASLVGTDYHIKIEQRCANNRTGCTAPAGEIYTAIAWRKTRSDELGIMPFTLPELSIDHTDECGRTRPVRGGVGLRLSRPDQPDLWVLSVHLKAACKDDKIEGGTLDDCRTQARQFEILRTWMAARQADGGQVLVLGDFNRKLLKVSDSQRKRLSDVEILATGERSCWVSAKPNFGALKRRAFERHPEFQATGRSPWIYHPKFTNMVDHALISQGSIGRITRAEQVSMEGRYRLGDIADFLIRECDGSLRTDLAFADSYPSDHCPLVVEME